MCSSLLHHHRLMTLFHNGSAFGTFIAQSITSAFLFHNYSIFCVIYGACSYGTLLKWILAEI